MFEIRLVAPGTYSVRVSGFGYEMAAVDSVTVHGREAVRLGDIAVVPGPLVVDDIRVEVRRGQIRGQERVRQRQLLGTGTFFAGAVIERERPESLTWYLAEKSGLEVRYGNRGIPFLRSTARPYDCVLVQVNHWPLHRSGYRSLDEIRLDWIAAIEVYPTYRDVPPERRLVWETDQRCGLLNVWLWNSW